MSPLKLLIYAMGGGFGHLTRSLALARAALKRGHRVHILCNTHAAQLFDFSQAIHFGRLENTSSKLTGDFTITAFSPDDSHDKFAESIQRFLQDAEYDVLVVDTFPRGLIGELVAPLSQIRCPKVLVHRDLNPNYVEQYELADFVRANYRTLVMPGEEGPLAQMPGAILTAPWLACDSDELLSSEAAREALFIEPEDDRPVVAVTCNGKPDEQDECVELSVELREQLGDRAIVRLVTLDQGICERHPKASVRMWPFLRLHRSVDLVIGSGGYNTVHECRATGTRLLAIARKRLYDRQAKRLLPAEVIPSPADAQQRIAGHLDSLENGYSKHSVRYVNGATQAIEHLEALL
jgi:hypothetical protein